MVKSASIYSPGDIVVHRSYGIGRIDSVENKPLNGIDVECFKVETNNGIYWFPTENVDNPRVHPVATKSVINQAINILRSAPQNEEFDPIQWKDRIDEVQTGGDFLEVSGLVRDLAGLKMKKKLTRTQDQALNSLEERMLQEWAASLNVELDLIRPKLKAYIEEGNSNLSEFTT